MIINKQEKRLQSNKEIENTLFNLIFNFNFACNDNFLTIKLSVSPISFRYPLREGTSISFHNNTTESGKFFKTNEKTNTIKCLNQCMTQ